MTFNFAKECYKPFAGPYKETMPQLIKEGRVPISVSQILQMRLILREGPEEMKKSWTNKLLFTGDAIAYYPKHNKVKVLLDCKHLREITPDTKIVNGRLVITEEEYKKLDAEEVSQYEWPGEDEYGEKETRINPYWRILARDQAILDEYINYAFEELPFMHNGTANKTCMGAGLETISWRKHKEEKNPGIRPVAIDPLNSSDLEASLHIDKDYQYDYISFIKGNASLIGIDPDAKQNAEAVLKDPCLSTLK